MPFGKYKGTPLSQVPDNYVDWLLDQDWFTEEGGKWEDLHTYFTEGEDDSPVAESEEVSRNKTEDIILNGCDPAFKSWWEQNYAKRLRDAKSVLYIAHLRIALAAWEGHKHSTKVNHAPQSAPFLPTEAAEAVNDDTPDPDITF